MESSEPAGRAPTPACANICATGQVIPAHPLALTADAHARRSAPARAHALLHRRRRRRRRRRRAHDAVRDSRLGSRTVSSGARAGDRRSARQRADTDRALRDDRRRVRTHRAGAHRSRDRRGARLRRRACSASATGERERRRAARALPHRSPRSIPLFGFYLQPAVGGRVLSYRFWREFAEIPNVWAIKIAPFNRYQTIDVVRAVVEAGRDDIALYTGNDDNIVADLLTPFPVTSAARPSLRWIDGGLLGQWAVWTRARRRDARGDQGRARVRRVRSDAALARCRAHRRERAPCSTPPTGSPAAFREFTRCCVARDCSTASGVSIRDETLSPGQADEITRVERSYPEVTDTGLV